MYRSEEGQMLPMVGVLLGAVALTLVMVGHVTAAAIAETKAQTAADAAALAGVLSGKPAAEVAATANQATLADYKVIQGDVLVRVRLG